MTIEKILYLFVRYFYTHECDTWTVALSEDCRFGLGTVLVLINIYTFMAECNKILEKAAYYIAALTQSATKYC